MSLLSVGRAIILSQTFRYVLIVIGCVFVILTAFLSIKPDPFLKFGYVGVFIYNMIGSGLLLFPTVSQKLNLFLLIFFSALGNIANTSLNYVIGKNSTTVLAKVPYTDKAKTLLKHFGLLGVYILAILPLPVDVNGLLSGCLGLPYRSYIVVNFLGKVTIFLLVGFGILSLTNFLHN